MDAAAVSKGLMVFGAIALLITLILFFTNVTCPGFGFSCERSSPPYTPTEAGITDQFFCKGPCIK